MGRLCQVLSWVLFTVRPQLKQSTKEIPSQAGVGHVTELEAGEAAAGLQHTVGFVEGAL